MVNKLSLSCTNFKVLNPNKQHPETQKVQENHKKLEKLKKTWLLRCKSNFLLANQSIDKRRLANIRPTQNRKLGPVIFGTLLGFPTALHELHLLDPRLTRVGSDNDVGAGQDHVLRHLVRVDPGRHEQDGPDEPGGVGDSSGLGSLRG